MPHALDFQKHFFRPRCGDVIFANLEPGIFPYQAAQVGLAARYVFCAELEIWFGHPVRYQGHTLHFAFHVVSPLRIR